MYKNIFYRCYSSLKPKLNLTPITVTDNAWKKSRNILEVHNDNWGFLFSAKGGGCGGFNYCFNPINREKYTKIFNESKIKPSIILDDTCKVMIDPYSEMFLLGTTIDYVKEDYSKNIFESKFVFKPNKDLATTCGCGVSFSPK